MARTPVNPYRSTSSRSGTLRVEIPELDDADLAALANDPDSFMADSTNRAKLFGIPSNQLKAKLADYGTRHGVDPQAVIKKVLTEIDW